MPCRLLFMNCQVVEFSLDSTAGLTRQRGNAPAKGSETTLADGKEYYLSDDPEGSGATLVHDKVLGTLKREDNTLQLEGQ